MKNIAIFISGKGSNAERMILRFSQHKSIHVSCLISSRSNTEISALCEQANVNYQECSWQLEDQENAIRMLINKGVEWIILAGFLKKIPLSMINAFPDKIINIHPSLLPKFGGKGMYGMHVHKAVIEANEKESGISIHYVNEEYDKGKIIAQIKIKIKATDDEISLFHRIRELEVNHFTRVVENEILTVSAKNVD